MAVAIDGDVVAVAEPEWAGATLAQTPGMAEQPGMTWASEMPCPARLVGFAGDDVGVGDAMSGRADGVRRDDVGVGDAVSGQAGGVRRDDVGRRDWCRRRDKEADADGVTVGVADAEVEGEVEGADDVGADDDGAGEVGGAEDGVDVDGGAEDGADEDGADEDGGDVGVGEAGMEVLTAVGAGDMGVVAGGDTLAGADA